MAFASLTIDLDARLASFEANLKRSVDVAQSRAAQLNSVFSNVVKSLPFVALAVAIHEVVEEVKVLVKSTAALDDFAEKTGASVEQLSRLQQVAAIGGHDFAGLTDILVKFSRALAGSDEESKGAGLALATIGLSAERLRQLDPGKALEELARKLNQYRDSGSKGALVTELLTKNAAQFLPYLKDLATEGGITAKVTGEQAAAAEELEKQFKRLASEAAELKRSLVIELTPALTEWVTATRLAFNEGGKLEALWVALGGAAKLAFQGSDNQQLVERLKAVNEQLSVARKQLESGTLKPEGAAGLFGFLIPNVKLTEQAITALRNTVDALEAEKARLQNRLNPPQAPDKPTLDFVKPSGKVDTRRNELADAELKIARAQAEAQLGIDKEINQQRLGALEQYNTASLLSIRDYYALRVSIAQTGLDQELQAINDQIVATAIRQRQARADAAAARAAGNTDKADNEDKAFVETQEKLIKLSGERQRLQIAVSGELSTLSLREKTAVDQLSSAVAGLNAQLLNLRGDTAAAGLLQFDEANRKLRQDLTTNFGANSPELKQLDTLRAQTKLQDEFNRTKETLDTINARLAISEERIAIAQRTGNTTELEALLQMQGTRRATLGLINEQIAKLGELALASDNPRLKLQLEQARVAAEKLGAEANLLSDKFKGLFGDAASGPLADFISKAKTANEAWAAFKNNILRGLAEIAAKQIASQALKGATSLFSSTTQSSSTGGSSGGGANAADTIGIVAAIVKLFSAGFASGGSFTVGGSGGTDSQLVAFRASPNERVVVQTPAQQRDVANRIQVTNVFHVSGIPDRSTQAQLAASAGLGVQRALARHT